MSTKRQGGLTLIELMVTVLLATILIGGLFYMMSGQEKTYNNQMRALSAQENLWGSMEYLQAEIRKAGFGYSGCGGQFKSVFDGGVAMGNEQGMSTALIVHNNHNLFCDHTTAAGSPECGPGGINDGTDSISLQYQMAEGDAGALGSMRVTKDHPLSSSNFFVNHPDNLGDGDLIVICAPGSTWGMVLQLTKKPKQVGGDYDEDGNGDYELEHNSGGSDWNPNNLKKYLPPGSGFPPGSTVVNLGSGNPEDKYTRYSIDKSRNPPLLVRWESDDPTTRQVIAEGIEDMQVSWTCDSGGGTSTASDGNYYEGPCNDTNGDGQCCGAGDTCTEREGDEWANNTATGGEVVPTCGTLPIRMVRITLVARTPSAVTGNRKGFRPTAEDHAAGTSAEDLTLSGGLGTYGRATLTAKVKPRNIRGEDD